MFGPLRSWLLSPRITFGKSLLSSLLLFSFSFIYIDIFRSSNILEKSFGQMRLVSHANIDAMHFHRASFGEDHLSGTRKFWTREISSTNVFLRLAVVFIICSIYFILVGRFRRLDQSCILKFLFVDTLRRIEFLSRLIFNFSLRDLIMWFNDYLIIYIICQIIGIIMQLWNTILINFVKFSSNFEFLSKSYLKIFRIQ